MTKLVIDRLIGRRITPQQQQIIDEGIAARLGVKEYRIDGEYLTFSRANMLRNAVVSYDEATRLPINKTVHVSEPHFNPTTIGYYGLECLSKFHVLKDRAHLDAALPVADYALKTISPTGTWPSPYSHHWFKGRSGDAMPNGWPSALSQGYLISFLSRLHVIDPKPEYLECSKKALQPFQTSVENGGVLRSLNPSMFGCADVSTRISAKRVLKDVLRPYYHQLRGRNPPPRPAAPPSLSFYEEYPTPLPSLVLNGFIFALFGLYDFWKVSSDSEAGQLYRAGEKTLQRMIPFYDLGWNTAYDLTHLHTSNWQTPPNACRKGYHQTHLIELAAMNCIENNKYAQIYFRWLLYDKGIFVSGN